MPSLIRISLVFLLLLVLGVVVLHRTFLVNPLLAPLKVNLNGKTCVVTGGTDGIGKETARQLFVDMGCDLVLPVRNKAKGEELKKEFEAEKKSTTAKITIVDQVDFTKLASLQRVLDVIGEKPVDVLVNNAGMLQLPLEKTVDGFETMFQVNHLAGFWLTYKLLPNLERAKGRVVFVSGMVHWLGFVGEKYLEKNNYGMSVESGAARYNDHKLLNIMTAKSFAERFTASKGVTFNSIHPGYVVSQLDSNLPGYIKLVLTKVRSWIARDTRSGAFTQVIAATHPKLQGVTGRHFDDYCMNDLCTTCMICADANVPGVKVVSEAYDKPTRDALFESTQKALKL